MIIKAPQPVLLGHFQPFIFFISTHLSEYQIYLSIFSISTYYLLHLTVVIRFIARYLQPEVAQLHTNIYTTSSSQHCPNYLFQLFHLYTKLILVHLIPSNKKASSNNPIIFLLQKKNIPPFERILLYSLIFLFFFRCRLQHTYATARNRQP